MHVHSIPTNQGIDLLYFRELICGDGAVIILYGFPTVALYLYRLWQRALNLNYPCAALNRINEDEATRVIRIR